MIPGQVKLSSYTLCPESAASISLEVVVPNNQLPASGYETDARHRDNVWILSTWRSVPLVKLLDTEIRSENLVFRVLIALFLASLSLAALYLAPRALVNYLKVIPDAQLQSLINQLLDPRIPTMGLIVSAFVLVTVTLRKTKIEGPLLICLGASLLSFWYILFHGGTITLPIPVTEVQQAMGINVPMSIEANVAVNSTTLMLAAMSTPILIIAKGVLLSVSRLWANVNSR